MKKFDMSTRFSGPIVALLLLGLLLINACAPKSAGVPAEGFYPEYYAVRTLTDSDVAKLKRIEAGANYEQKAAAGLILGKYYLTTGERQKGADMIKAYHNSAVLDPTMKLYGLLWLYDVYVLEGQERAARSVAAEISGREKDAEFERVMKVYCSREKLPGDVNSCFLAKLTSAGVVALAPETVETPTLQEPVESIPTNKKIMIDVANGTFNDDVVKGIVLAAQVSGAQYQMNIGKNAQHSDKNTFHITVDAKEKHVSLEDETFDFGVHTEDYLNEMVSFIMLHPYDLIVIGTSMKETGLAEQMRDRFEQEGFKTVTVNYESPEMQKELKSAMEGWRDRQFLFIGLGKEDDMMKFAPIGRYYIDKTKEQDLMLIVDAMSDQFFKNDYFVYFKNAYYLTNIQVLGNPDYQTFSDQYKKFYGNKPSIDALIGYDIVQFIKWKEHGASFETRPHYLSNIASCTADKAKRDLLIYHIVNNDQVVTVSY